MVRLAGNLRGLFAITFVLVLGAGTSSTPGSNKRHDLEPEGATSAIIENSGPPHSERPVEYCNAGWWEPLGTVSQMFVAGGDYYAVYQDPLEAGCPTVYPYNPGVVRWLVKNSSDDPVTVSEVEVITWDVDETDPACLKPGTELYRSFILGPLQIEAGAVYQLEGYAGGCVRGPYFVGAYYPESTPAGALSLVADDGTGPWGVRACASYRNSGQGWTDIAGNLNGNLVMYSQGWTENDCVSADVYPLSHNPTSNQLDCPTDSDIDVNFNWPGVRITNIEDGFRIVVSGLYAGMYEGFRHPPDTGTALGFGWQLSPEEAFAAGDLVTVVLSNMIEGGYGQIIEGYSWSFTAAVDSSKGTFTPGDWYISTNGPLDIAAADLNGDGFNDIVTPSSYNSGVGILWNQGDGSFSDRAFIVVGSFPEFVAIADLDNDRDLDIAVAEYASNTVSVLLNDGIGVFGARTSFASSGRVRALAAADVNNDGVADLLTCDSLANIVSVFINNGEGGLEPRIDYPVPARPQCLASGDFNNDGKTDLVVGHNQHPAHVTIVDNDGLGAFDFYLTYETDAPCINVIAAELNNDGMLDVAVATGENIEVLLNSEFGVLESGTAYPIEGEAHDLFAADVEGDGDLDLLVARRADDCVAVLLNDGAGAFALDASYEVQGWPIAMACADLDNDRDIDIVTASDLYDNVSTLFNDDAGCCGLYDPDGRTGNVDQDPGNVKDLTDILMLASYAFLGGDPPPCMADMNVSGDPECVNDLSDVLALANYAYLGGPDPAYCLPECEE